MSGERKKKEFYPTLTIMRAFAALIVAVYHVLLSWPIKTLGFVSEVGGFGWLGVGFFFALSGFVLTRAHVNDIPINRKRFYCKRLVRIYPLHILTFIIAVIFYELSGKSWAGVEGPHFAWSLNLLLIHDWLPHHPGIRQSLNGVSWTLSCELFFYLLGPWLIELLREIRLDFGDKMFCAVWCAYAAIAAASYGSKQMQDLLYFWPPIRLIEFASGCWIGVRFKPLLFEWWRVVVLGGTTWIASSVFFAIILRIKNDPFLVALCLPGFLALISGVASRDSRCKTADKSRAGKFLLALGNASFALYMIHVLILVCFGAIARRLFGSNICDTLQLFLAATFLIVSTIAALLVDRFIDQPLHRRLILQYRA